MRGRWRAWKVLYDIYQEINSLETIIWNFTLFFADPELGKWALKSETAAAVRSMVTLARSDKRIWVDPEQLDADPWLFNCANGTLDLRTGTLRPPKPEDLLTKQSPVRYDPEARLPLWEEFLAWFQPAEDMRAFLQRAAGYCLTGLGREEVLFFPFGNTRTGKSTFLRALRSTWGPDYGTTADPETWMKRHAVNGAPRHDIADLSGARLVVSSEVAEGATLAEWLVKWLFGGEYVKARFLYQDPFEFLPTFKLWLSANHRPKVAPDDDAVWRRIRQIPCEQQVAEGQEDPSIKERLSTPAIAGPAILAWAMQGCLAWQQERLKPPQAVLDATTAYREEMNPIPQFLEDNFLQERTSRVSNAVMWSTYQAWAAKNSDFKRLGRTQLSRALLKAGIDQEKSGLRYWMGLKLIAWQASADGGGG